MISLDCEDWVPASAHRLLDEVDVCGCGRSGVPCPVCKNRLDRANEIIRAANTSTPAPEAPAHGAGVTR